MREAQLAWLPAILGRKGETAACTSGFLLASHIGVVCPGAKVHGGTVRNSNGLWDATKASTQHCLEVRTLIDEAGPSAVVAELSGDLNKEHLYAAGAASYGFTAVGMSRRGGNDPGFHRVILSDDGGQVTEVEAYQMKRGCEFSWGHSFVESYAPHLDDGFNAAKVAPPHMHMHMHVHMHMHMHCTAHAHAGRGAAQGSAHAARPAKECRAQRRRHHKTRYAGE